MTHTILKVAQDGDSILTTVAFVFDDGSEDTLVIPHFMPGSKEDVLLGIENRGVSEYRKRTAASINADIVVALEREAKDVAVQVDIVVDAKGNVTRVERIVEVVDVIALDGGVK